MASKDVTKLVDFGINDDEALPVTKCVCGAEFGLWEFIISVYPDSPTACPNCGRKFYFRICNRIFEVIDE